VEGPHPAIGAGIEPKSAFLAPFTCGRQASLLKSETRATRPRRLVNMVLERAAMARAVSLLLLLALAASLVPACPAASVDFIQALRSD
jgi:hypothetical protein